MPMMKLPETASWKGLKFKKGKLERDEENVWMKRWVETAEGKFRPGSLSSWKLVAHCQRLPRFFQLFPTQRAFAINLDNGNTSLSTYPHRSQAHFL
jgi:hypothetical protein